MELWDAGKFNALIDDTEDEVLSRVGSGRRTSNEESEIRKFNSTVLSGRLRQAVRGFTNRDGGGVLQPDDLCTKAGRPILSVLRAKHPRMRDPDLTGDDPAGAFEPYDSIPEPVPLDVTPQDVEKIASKLSGAAGPSGVDAVALRSWLLRFGAESDTLRAEIAAVATLLSNESPSWAQYRALMANRLVALDKQPGTRPVGIGEIVRRLIAKCVIARVGYRATAACGSLQLCAGLPAGIEGAVHALQSEWEEAGDDNPPPEPAPLIPANGDEPPAQDAGAGENPMLLEEAEPPPDLADDDPAVALLIDATNGFNELGRKAMLWTVRHRWAAGARFAFNCYRHAGQLILRRRGQSCYVINSEEGITQGDPLAMLLYGTALLPLVERLRQAVPTVTQPWYADDAAMSGPCSEIARAMALLETLGPARGYYPEPAKSIVICRASHIPAAQEQFSDFQFKYCDGHRYVGGFIGTKAAKAEWLDQKIQNWVYGVERLARAAVRFPQTAYAGLSKSLQSEWQYLQRVLPDAGPAFAPVEQALREKFLPALMQETAGGLTEKLREYAALPVRKAGIGVPNPVDTAAACYATSVASTAPLTESLCAGTDFDVDAYLREANAARSALTATRNVDGDGKLSQLLGGASARTKRRVNRAKRTGAWLTAMPDTLNGTDLSAEEFRDSLRLRYGLPPRTLPSKCDGCSQDFTVEHALSCKKGGLVSLRHNDVAYEWHQLCAQALTPSAVTDEPLIHSGRDTQQRAHGLGNEVPPESRGDVSAHGFWKRGTTAIFDVRITDTDAPTYRNQDPVKVLASHEKLKKDKYLDKCLERRRQFTPLVFSVDGLRGREADAAAKRLAALLAAKWNRAYSDVCNYVRSRLAIALVRSTSMCLRGARDPTARATQPTWENGAGFALYRI
jgi:hypothetical protein